MKKLVSLFLISLSIISCGEKPQLSQVTDMLVSSQVSADQTLWPNQKDIIVKFLNGNESQKNEVMYHALEWTRYANLQFIFTDESGNVLKADHDKRNFRLPMKTPVLDKSKFIRSDIRILFNEAINNSVVGTSAYLSKENEPTMRLSTTIPVKGVRRGMILHEFGHALGLLHEHQNTNRTFKFNHERVYEYCKSKKIDSASCKANMLDISVGSKINSTQYDQESVMNYVFDDIVYEQESIEKDLTPHPHHYLSLKDKMFIASLYPGRVNHDQIKKEHELLKREFYQVGRCIVLKPGDVDHDGQFAANCGPNQFAIGIILEDLDKPLFGIGTCQKSLSKITTTLHSAAGCE